MMIQTAPPGEKRFVSTMVEHLDLCYQFALAFGNDEFEQPEPMRNLFIQLKIMTADGIHSTPIQF